MTPDEYCQEKAAKSGSSFYHTFVFLPPAQRRAITALYAFCREVDDVVDEVAEPAVAQAKLDWWRTEVDAAFHDAAQHPVSRALSSVRERSGIEAAHLHEIIDGMQMDLDGRGYATLDELLVYCWRAAGVVGLLSAKIFGYDDPRTERYAGSLGIAFQLTNIIRDVREDTARGRTYFATADMARHGVHTGDLAADTTGGPLRALLHEYAAHARGHYDAAYAALPERDRYSQRCGLMMAAIYERLLAKMHARGFRVLECRPALHPLHKIWIAWRCGVTEERRRRRGAAP